MKSFKENLQEVMSARKSVGGVVKTLLLEDARADIRSFVDKFVKDYDGDKDKLRFQIPRAINKQFGKIDSGDLKDMVDYGYGRYDFYEDQLKSFFGDIDKARLNAPDTAEALDKRFEKEEREAERREAGNVGVLSDLVHLKKTNRGFWNWLVDKGAIDQNLSEKEIDTYLQQYESEKASADSEEFEASYAGKDRVHGLPSVNIYAILGGIDEPWSDAVFGRYVKGFGMDLINSQGMNIEGPHPLNLNKSIGMTVIEEADRATDSTLEVNDIDRSGKMKADPAIMKAKPETEEYRVSNVLSKLFPDLPLNRMLAGLRNNGQHINRFVAKTNHSDDMKVLYSFLSRDDIFRNAFEAIDDRRWLMKTANKATHKTPGVDSNPIKDAIINAYNSVYYSEGENQADIIDLMADLIKNVYADGPSDNMPPYLAYNLSGKHKTVDRNAVKDSILSGYSQKSSGGAGYDPEKETVSVVSSQDWPRVGNEEGDLPPEVVATVFGSNKFIEDATRYYKDIFSRSLGKKKQELYKNVDRVDAARSIIYLINQFAEKDLKAIYNSDNPTEEVAKEQDKEMERRYKILSSYIAEDMIKHQGYLDKFKVYYKDQQSRSEEGKAFWVKLLDMAQDDKSGVTISPDGESAFVFKGSLNKGTTENKGDKPYSLKWTTKSEDYVKDAYTLDALYYYSVKFVKLKPSLMSNVRRRKTGVEGEEGLPPREVDAIFNQVVEAVSKKGLLTGGPVDKEIIEEAKTKFDYWVNRQENRKRTDITDFEGESVLQDLNA